ncbi:nuclear transport factor 2 family protein [Streptomyces sp. NRRL F-5123]|uniref:nuclear transport factor 2 family protein n=1 Tax=Streptomyces sp. NRRL F-5123 TaxID=1463856 RepID=UPI000A526BFB|nr:nuclear transport factor 2 family protein [Streptomyces sp. NRRL F-5123]
MPDAEVAAPRSPYDVLDRYYQAMLDKSADDLADLYAVDAVHEFPFSVPGFPPSFEGREAVRAGYRASWSASPVRVEEIRRIAVHQTTDPEVIVAEQVVLGTVPATGAAFGVPGLLVLRVHGGRISRVRDYIDTSGLGSART